MGRVPRIDIPGFIYHVTARGARQLSLFQDNQDNQMFLRFLLQAREQIPFCLHAYCLMTNHFHLLIQTLNDSLANIMQSCLRRFSSWLNLKYSRTGHSFQGPFHSIPVEKEGYFKTVARYIHLNPVRAGIVLRPEEYDWSNYGKLIRGERDPLVDPQLLLGYFQGGAESPIENYKRFVEDMIQRPEPITQEVLHRMRSWGSLPVIGNVK
jgi:putative transposase